MPQSIDPSKRSRTTQDEILVAFRDRLRESIPSCTDKTCFISDQPIPPMIPAGGGHCVTVAIGDGVFNERLFIGGSHSTLNEECQIIITPMVMIVIDRVPQAERAMLAPDRGILTKWKRDILRSLLVTDPDLLENSQAWEPVVDDRPLCRDQVRPISASAPADIPGHPGWIGLHIPFAVSFDWKLYG